MSNKNSKNVIYAEYKCEHCKQKPMRVELEFDELDLAQRIALRCMTSDENTISSYITHDCEHKVLGMSKLVAVGEGVLCRCGAIFKWDDTIDADNAFSKPGERMCFECEEIAEDDYAQEDDGESDCSCGESDCDGDCAADDDESDNDFCDHPGCNGDCE